MSNALEKKIREFEKEFKKNCKTLGIKTPDFLKEESKYLFVSRLEEFTKVDDYFFNFNLNPLIVRTKDLIKNNKNKIPIHWEYWVDLKIVFKDGKYYENLSALKWDYDSVLTMISFSISAGKVFNEKKWSEKDLLLFFLVKKERRLIHKDTEELLMFLFELIRDSQGNLEETLSYIRHKKKIISYLYNASLNDHLRNIAHLNF